MFEAAASAAPMALVSSSAPSTNPTVSTLGKQSRTGHRKSGSVFIEGMATSISRLVDAVATDAAVLSPEHKHAAIHAIEDDGDLSDEEQQLAYKIICHDTSFADTILAIRKKAACTRFIKSELYEK